MDNKTEIIPGPEVPVTPAQKKELNQLAENVEALGNLNQALNNAHRLGGDAKEVEIAQKITATEPHASEH